MTKSNRLLKMWMYVNSKRTFTARELADEFGVSVRTVQRDLIDLSEWGVPLYAEQGREGGYRLLTNRMLPPIFFTEEEATAMFFGFQSLEYYRTLPFKAEVDAALQKFYTNLPQDARIKIDKMKDILVFWTSYREIEAPELNTLLHAVIEGLVISCRYESKSGIKEINVKPLGIYSLNGLWYCPAYSYIRERVLLYRVDRMSQIIEIGTDALELPTLKQWLKGENVKQPVLLKVELNTVGVRHCRTNPLFEKHVMKQGESWLLEMEIEKEEVAFVASFFYELGRDAIVKEPIEMRQFIRQKAEEVLSLYSS
ncbi:helix-turn-helix transcriptional regulator [Metabacillus iocasae]|uniref:DNA-binding transcriptional regulator YafY n=1 Tax=Priestia iocasae TaxID=2291674 RepID=A0ABS2QWK0_9BACI|nr:YafY family protein [Metabacillus iocasae]MBM7703658.1 putative DNA-binding transcriptional regulator YafY [Metabacillus iocasae]